MVQLLFTTFERLLCSLLYHVVYHLCVSCFQLLVTNSYIPYISASFEVTVNGTVVHSKLQTMAFPDFEEVAEVVEDVSKGQEIRVVTKHQPSSCSIM